MLRVRAAAVLAVAVLLAAPGVARAQPLAWASPLAPEAPGAAGSGRVLVTYDPITFGLSIQARWSGLSGVTTVAHIHCCLAEPLTGTAGVAVTPVTLPGFPVGVSSGTYFRTVMLDDAASFTSGFVTNFGGGTLEGARAALLAGMDDGRAYFNVHSNNFPGGEIRGFLTTVPEPSTYALTATGLAVVAAVARRRRA